MTRTEKETTPRAPRNRADFACDTAGGQMTVRIRGEIDHHTAVEVRQGIDKRLFERRPRRLLLDLSAVSFMDSSGLGLIMGRLSVMRELGGELVVWNPSREVLRIVTLAGMECLVRIEYPPERQSEQVVDGEAAGDRGRGPVVRADRKSGHLPDTTPGRPSAPPPSAGQSAPETRSNAQNHRSGHRAATAQNRGSTAARRSPNGVEKSPSTRRDPQRKEKDA